jgi:hypothetical protein
MLKWITSGSQNNRKRSAYKQSSLWMVHLVINTHKQCYLVRMRQCIKTLCQKSVSFTFSFFCQKKKRRKVYTLVPRYLGNAKSRIPGVNRTLWSVLYSVYIDWYVPEFPRWHEITMKWKYRGCSFNRLASEIFFLI